MTAQSKTVIKSYFVTDAQPDQTQFGNLVDSYQDVLAPASATLVGGTILVTASSVTSLSSIFYNRSTTGGTPGHLSYVIASGASVTFNSSSGTDTSTLVYFII